MLHCAMLEKLFSTLREALRRKVEINSILQSSLATSLVVAIYLHVPREIENNDYAKVWEVNKMYYGP